MIINKNDITIIITDSKNSLNWFRGDDCYYAIDYNNRIKDVIPCNLMHQKKRVEHLDPKILDALLNDFRN